jgi:hypothetical protein
MTDDERDKLKEIEKELRQLGDDLDSDEVGEIADQISELIIPIHIRRPQ